MSNKNSTTSGHTGSKSNASQVAAVLKGAMPRSRVNIQRMQNQWRSQGGHEGAQHPLRTFAPPLAKFLEDEFFSDTIMYKRGKAIFLDFNPEKSEKKILKIQKNPEKSEKIQKNPKIQKNLKFAFPPLKMY
jgi:hypothetical protein